MILLSFAVSQFACSSGGSNSSATPLPTPTASNTFAFTTFISLDFDNTLESFVLSVSSLNSDGLLSDAKLSLPTISSRISFNESYAYVGISPGGLSYYRVDKDGGLTKLGDIARPDSVESWQPVLVGFYGNYAYISDDKNNNIWQYSVSNNGAISYVGQVAAAVSDGWDPGNIVFNNGYAYVINNGEQVFKYSVGNSGVLSNPESIATSQESTTFTALVFDNNSAYVSQFSSDKLSVGKIVKYSVESNGDIDNPINVALTGVVSAGSVFPVVVNAINNGYAYITSLVIVSGFVYEIQVFKVINDTTFSYAGKLSSSSEIPADLVPLLLSLYTPPGS